jgi:hypothetical protein
MIHLLLADGNQKAGQRSSHGNAALSDHPRNPAPRPTNDFFFVIHSFFILLFSLEHAIWTSTIASWPVKGLAELASQPNLPGCPKK